MWRPAPGRGRSERGQALSRMRHGIVSIMLAIVYRKQGTDHPVDGLRRPGSAKRWLSRDGQILERSHTGRAPAARGAPHSDMPRVIGMIPAGMAAAGRGGAGIFFDGHTGGAVQSRRRGWGSPCGSAGASRRRTGPRGLACPPKDGLAVTCNEVRPGRRCGTGLPAPRRTPAT